MIQFLLNVWDPGGEWSCGKFNLIEAYGVWNEKERDAFLIWAINPRWPERASAEGRPMNAFELRDRAFCAVMTYTMPRVSSICGMRVADYYRNGKTSRLRFNQGKGGMHDEMPAHHKLIAYLDAYLE